VEIFEEQKTSELGYVGNFFCFFTPLLSTSPPCKLNTEAVVEEKVHRVSPIDSNSPPTTLGLWY